MSTTRDIGAKIRRMRLAAGLAQVDFAERVGIATGSVSKLENGQMPLSDDLLRVVGGVLDCSPHFLSVSSEVVPATRPWLRAYADAPKRAVDRQIAECTLAIEVAGLLQLKAIPDTVPVFTGDLLDDSDIEQFAMDVRAAAQLDERDVVGNAIRSAERLGCVVLPMRAELGRHLGLSTRANLTPVICVSRPSNDPDRHVPGDRQRFTVAHELGHISLHSSLGPPETAEEAGRIERQAHRFAAAFLAPGDAMLDELDEHGGRVTLRTLAVIKDRWGVAIKALVTRFRNLGVIDAEQARSLYKQISARGWNKNEPVPVGNEQAIWLRKAIEKRAAGASDPLKEAADIVGIGRAHLARWVDWSPTNTESEPAEVIEFVSRRSDDRDAPSGPGGTVTRLPIRRP